jgi:cellulose synthase/poly-beta-1,6-N-acetylglucosamine synthase-like glycosyltransferase
MGDDGPVVSVVIAARDAAATIGDQLDALARQRVEVPWEVVVSDNGSTDATAAVVRSHASALPSLRVVDASAARGAGGARNVGVEAARGSIVAFCDADDIVDDGWLAGIVAAMRDHDFVGCTWGMSRLNPEHPEGLTMGPTFRLETLPHLAFAGAGAMAVRRHVFLAVGGFDTSLPIGEDTDLSWRIQLAGTPLGEAPNAIVHIRERSELGATLRQWYRYGRAERQLRVKFAHVPVPADAAPAEQESPGGQAAELADSAKRKLRRLVRMRGWRDVAPFLQRQARRAGLRWGRIDRSVRPYDGPGSIHAERATA